MGERGMSRRWTPGDGFAVDGLEFRVKQGRKGPDDIVLEMRGPTGWAPITFALGFVVMDVLGENEDVLYPRGMGGGYLHRELLCAWREGWRVAWSKLQQDRKKADEKREGQLFGAST